MTDTFDIALWVVFPYLCMLLFIGGHVWRYRYDKFGWTTRSSQLQESRLLRWASPLFHFGILIVFVGHVIGLGVPNSWTAWLGISDDAYHTVAVTSGWAAGLATVVGLAGLIYRRRTTGAVFYATTPMDKFMYVVLGTVIALGMWSLMATTFDWNQHYDYREGVAIWFRGLFLLDLRPDLMVQAPINMQLHSLAGFAIFALWPFTRLVHVFSAPVWYLFRPYVVYRSRTNRLGSRTARRGWDRVGTGD